MLLLLERTEVLELQGEQQMAYLIHFYTVALWIQTDLRIASLLVYIAATPSTQGVGNKPSVIDIVLSVLTQGGKLLW